MFTNLALSTTATIAGFKNLDSIATTNFQFELRDQHNYLVDTTISNEQGIFTPKTPTFAQTSTYTYYVNEVIGNDENMSYDNNQYKDIVKVERVGDELVVSMRYKLNSVEVESVTFNNKTVAAVLFGGNKYMNGKLDCGYKFQLKNGNDKTIRTVMSDEIIAIYSETMASISPLHNPPQPSDAIFGTLLAMMTSPGRLALAFWQSVRTCD